MCIDAPTLHVDIAIVDEQGEAGSDHEDDRRCKLTLAIVGAEYVLRWLEPGTHRWEQFVTPLELTGFARAAGLRRQSLRGMVYDPFGRDWRLSSDVGVNYLFAATKPDV